MEPTEIASMIRAELARRQTTPFRAAQKAGLSQNAIRYVLEGRATRSDQLARICDALGLEFYIGPPRARGADSGAGERRDSTSGRQASRIDGSAIEQCTQDLVGAVLDAGGNPFPDDVAPEAAVMLVAADALSAGTDTGDILKLIPLAASGNCAEHPQASASERVSRMWLDQHELDPRACAVLHVSRETMGPETLDGWAILVHRNRRRRRGNRVYAVQVRGRLVVKRAVRLEGAWHFAGTPPERTPVPWPVEARIIGEVVWAGRTLVDSIGVTPEGSSATS